MLVVEPAVHRLGGPAGGPGGHRRGPAASHRRGLGCALAGGPAGGAQRVAGPVPARRPGEWRPDRGVVGLPAHRQRPCLDIRGRCRHQHLPPVARRRRHRAHRRDADAPAARVGRDPQDIWLVLFAGASLLLVLRLDLESQRDGWLRRRIGGGQGVGGLFLRGGAAVVACMLIGSLVLASVAGTSSVAAAFPQLEALVDDLAVTRPGPGGRGGSGCAGHQRRVPQAPPDQVVVEPGGGDRVRRRATRWATGTTGEAPAGTPSTGRPGTGPSRPPRTSPRARTCWRAARMPSRTGRPTTAA